MDYSLKPTALTDKTIRFSLEIDGESVGELQMSREATTRFAELLFKGKYKIIIDETKID